MLRRDWIKTALASLAATLGLKPVGAPASLYGLSESDEEYPFPDGIRLDLGWVGRRFDVQGFTVEERVYATWKQDVFKLIWAAQDFTFIEIPRSPERDRTRTVLNPMVHADFKVGRIEEARKKVEAAFVEYWTEQGLLNG